MKKVLVAVLGLMLTVGLVFANGQEETQAQTEQLLKGNLRIVIGSTSTGGDTYTSAAIVAKYLADELGLNIKVDACGVEPAFDALNRDKTGHTIMIYHDQAYLGYLYGVEGYFDIFKDYKMGPTLSVNPGNGYLAPKDSRFNNLQDVIDACGHGETVRIAIQPGGTSQIGYTALANEIMIQYPGKEANLVPVWTGSQSDKDQLLFDDQADVIQGSVQSNEQYTQLPASDQKAMKFLWLTASKNTVNGADPEGYGSLSRDTLLTYVEPKALTNGFTFDKDFFIVYNNEMDTKLVKYFDDALQKIYDTTDIKAKERKTFLIPNFLPSAKAYEYMQKKITVSDAIIKSLQK